jgi:5'-nucleotidase
MALRALITNDDGIDAHGLSVLAGVAHDAGLQVTVAAPDGGRSGASAALSALEEDGRLLMAETRLPNLPDVPAYAVKASPAFIVMTGARGAFGFIPDLVLSGVNHGPNTGHAILHSGTVGAALTAYTQGIRAMAVSLASGTPTHWGTAARSADAALRWYLDTDTPDVLNVNVPDVPVDRWHGMRAAALAGLGAVQAQIGHAGEGYVSVTLDEVTDHGDPGTDAHLVWNGYTTLTLIKAPVASETELPDLG